MTPAGEKLPLALLAAGLAGLAGVELRAPFPAGAPPGHHPTSLPASTPAAADADARPAPKQAGRAILARPLFRPDRRPPSVETAPVATAKLPRLSGILIGRGFRLALFAGESGKTRIAAKGERIAGYRIVAINPASVVLAGADGRRTLTPRFEKSSSQSKDSVPEPSTLRLSPGPGAPERR